MSFPRGPRLFAVLLGAGLVLRLILCLVNGVHDLDQYAGWGLGTRANGLAATYMGIYFPFQYQLFALAASLSAALGSPLYVSLKLLNLAFDAGILVLLLALARDMERRWWVLWLYWLNPWFLALFALGYCDFQLAFFLLLFLYLFREDGSLARSLVAGIPLALAFLMKPQVAVALAMIGALGFFLLLRRRRLVPPLAAALIPCVILFAGYNVYFALSGVRAGHLADSYLGSSAVMPVLTANMLNIWHPIVTLLHPGEAVSVMRDDTALAGGVTLRGVALAATLGLLAWYAGVAVLRRPRYDLMLAITYAVFLVPLLMTGAHENHLFLATIGFVAVHARSGLPGGGLIVFAVLCLLSTLNLAGHYGLGRNVLSSGIAVSTLQAAWSLPWLRLLCGAFMVLTFVAAVAIFFSQAAGDAAPLRTWTSRLPVFGLAAFLVLLYCALAVPALA